MPKQRSPVKPAPDRRPLIFAALVGICLLAVVAYTLRAMTLKPAPPPAADTPADASVLASVVSRPHLVFLHSPGGDTYRQVAIVPLDAIDGQRYLTPLICQRVSMNASNGLCMSAGQSANTFDARFQLGPVSSRRALRRVAASPRQATLEP